MRKKKQKTKMKARPAGFISSREAIKRQAQSRKQNEKETAKKIIGKFRFGKKDSGKVLFISTSGKRIKDPRKERGYLVYKSKGERVYFLEGLRGKSYRAKLLTSYNFSGFFAKSSVRKAIKLKPVGEQKTIRKKGKIVGTETIPFKIIKANNEGTAWENFREWFYSFFKKSPLSHFVVRTTWKVKRGKSFRYIRSVANLPVWDQNRADFYKSLWPIYWEAVQQQDDSFDYHKWATSGSSREIKSRNKGVGRGHWREEKDGSLWRRRFYDVVKVLQIKVELETL